MSKTRTASVGASSLKYHFSRLSAVGHNWEPQIGNVPVKRMSSPLCPPQASGGSSQIKPDDSRARLKTDFSSLLLVVIRRPFSLMLENWLAGV